jgi:hypothetical protein
MVRFANKIHRLTCDQPIELAYYPSDPIFHFFTHLQPATKYMFMPPWVADVGLPEVEAELSSHQSAVVSIKPDRRIWQDYVVKDYLAGLISFLNDHYVLVEENLWVSPALTETCPSQYKP